MNEDLLVGYSWAARHLALLGAMRSAFPASLAPLVQHAHCCLACSPVHTVNTINAPSLCFPPSPSGSAKPNLVLSETLADRRGCLEVFLLLPSQVSCCQVRTRAIYGREIDATTVLIPRHLSTVDGRSSDPRVGRLIPKVHLRLVIRRWLALAESRASIG